MEGTLILFLISITGLVAMFWMKLHEIQNGKALYPEHVRKYADEKLYKTIDTVAREGSKVGDISIRRTLLQFFSITGIYVAKGFKKVSNSDNKLVNFIKGKKVLERQEKRSDFLNSIEENKRENGGGEIEG